MYVCYASQYQNRAITVAWCSNQSPEHLGKLRLLGRSRSSGPEGPKVEAKGRERGVFLGEVVASLLGIGRTL